MELVDEQIEDGVKCVRLNGRLDMKGTGEIELRFTSLTATNDVQVVVDMSGVDFVASIGMRLLVSCAKANAARGGQLVLASLRPLVRESLETAGISSLIPLFADEQSARASLAA
jgi:anti-anti-sigma factor